jgi:hypothetical protein
LAVKIQSAEQSAPVGYKHLQRLFASAPPDVQWYFQYLPRLLPDFPYEVAIAYMSALVETAKHMTLYCGIVKLHMAESEMTRAALRSDFMERKRFLDLYRIVFGQPVAPQALLSLERAEETRDMVLHGKVPSAPEMRQAIADFLTFATEFNGMVQAHAGFRPFGQLTGFKGARAALDRSTTRWLLKGMGLNIS